MEHRPAVRVEHESLAVRRGGRETPLPEDERNPHEVAFTLSFDFPGKARRRTPDNWADFETCLIRLKDDQWTSTPVGQPEGKPGKMPRSREVFYDALIAAINNTAGRLGEDDHGLVGV